MIDCVISGVSQDMDLERNVTTTFLLIRLPDGSKVRAAVDDATAALVVGMSVARSGQPTASLQVPDYVQAMTASVDAAREALWPEDSNATLAPAMVDQTVVPPAARLEDVAPRIFGGQDGGDEPTEAASMEVVEQPARPTRSNVQQLANGKVIVPARTVPRDSHGYPIAPNAGVRAESLTATNNRDEDGIGSV